MNAAELEKNQKAVVKSIYLSNEDVDRLFYMGVYQGAEIRKIRSSCFYDPILFCVNGNYLAIRRKDAKCIRVEEIR